MKIVAYIRTSTEAQLLSIETQRAKITAYAQVHDHEIVEWCEDAGASGKTLDRPALARGIALVEAGKADALCVAKIDRLTRSQPEFAELLDGPIGSRIVCIEHMLDPSTANGRLVLRMLREFDRWSKEDRESFDLALELAKRFP